MPSTDKTVAAPTINPRRDLRGASPAGLAACADPGFANFRLDPHSRRHAPPWTEARAGRRESPAFGGIRAARSGRGGGRLFGESRDDSKPHVGDTTPVAGKIAHRFRIVAYDWDGGDRVRFGGEAQIHRAV